MPDSVDIETVREHVLECHADTIRAVIAAADTVADRVEEPTGPNGAGVSAELERELTRRELVGPLVAVLVDAIGAAGIETAAQPVPGPPYVTVTSLGPVLRATGSRGRLVITLRVFAVDRTDGTQYHRTGDDPGAVLEIDFR